MKMRKQQILKILVVAGAIIFTGCGSMNLQEKDELSYRKAGIQYMEKGNYEQAAKAFQKALDYANGRIGNVELDICYYKALSFARMGEVSKAEEVYNALINYDSDNADAYLQRGNLYAFEQKVKEAVADYEKAIALKPGKQELYMAVYENLLAAGAGKTQAQSYLKRALQLSDESGEDYRNKGKIYYILGEYDKAKQYLSMAENEGDEEARLYMARVYEAAGEKQQAYAIYESYDKTHKDSFAKLRLVNLVMEQKEYEKALTYITEAKKLVEKDQLQQLLTYEIIALEKTGDKEQAKKALQSYTRTYPEDQKAKRELAFLEYTTEAEEQQ